ncbi:Kdo hydroxylase family protein [Microvirga puerhi]|uniref:Kdo hydroxylase family protein n=1 Tax=Microvirga puerhi TaxID=2876078 RepID=A0ABS7VTX1_9HYPH|nr:Kdo hydroxylase family protein [Microvirga puerhi]MBZ6078397.1 Kdo hydroxylase family protein [Microvirga puerhi]
MSMIESLDIDCWSGPFPAEVQDGALSALEGGRVVFCPNLAFALRQEEATLLSSDFASGNAKNISLDPARGEVSGTTESGETEQLHAMMQRFAQATAQIVAGLFPTYAKGIGQARTSYRPIEIVDRQSSPRKNDKLLHVDAFPSRPTRGRRILRVFSNINPAGKPRIWHVGEPFEEFARKYVGVVRRPYPLEPSLLAVLGITKGKRSAYDQIMLGLHDKGKLDARYQKEAPQTEFAFPAGTTWLCYTDQVLHAALAGQFALEQTFHVDVAALAHPERSPLRVLERMTGQSLV